MACILFLFILHLLGEEVAKNFGYGVLVGYFFVVSTTLGMWLASALNKPPLGDRDERFCAVPQKIYPVLAFGALVLFAYVMLDAVFVQQLGVADKRALKEIGAGLVGADTALNWSLFFYVLILWGAWNRVARRYLLVSLAGVVVLYVWAATGERDSLLKWVIITSFLFLFKRSLGVRFVYALGVLVFLSLPLTKDLGVLLSSEEVDLRRTEDISVWVLKLEWKTSGENLDHLLERKELYQDLGAERFFGDVYRGIVPGAFVSVTNTRDWYYSEYTPVVTGRDIPGAGFSYAGSWYVYANMFGVAIGGLVFGVASWILYIWSYRNAVWNSVYLVFVPLAIWSLRSDFSGLLSSLFKQSILPAVLVFFLFYVLRAVACRKNIR